MKLEEAKEQLESLKESIKSSIEEPTDVEDVFVQDVQAIETVLQELKHLQKENEELRELKYKIIDRIEEKRKALRYRTPIEEILEYEFVKLRNELLEEE